MSVSLFLVVDWNSTRVRTLLCCSVQFSHSVVSNSLRPHGLQQSRLPCPSPAPSLLKLMSVESVTPSNRLILCCPLLLLLSIFPSIRVFSNESDLCIRWPKYWLSSVPFTTGCRFCFGSIPSFFLELFLHWSPVAYWAPTDLGSSSFSVLSFCLFILFTGFSRQEYWSGLSFPSTVDHTLSDLSTMTRRLGWPHMAWLSFIELDKAVVHVIKLASCPWL